MKWKRNKTKRHVSNNNFTLPSYIVLTKKEACIFNAFDAYYSDVYLLIYCIFLSILLCLFFVFFCCIILHTESHSCCSFICQLNSFPFCVFVFFYKESYQIKNHLTLH